MALLSAFNPHDLKADTVLRVATGRDEPLARLLGIIRSNLTAPTKQHVIVSAPRGYGKSFLLRYVQVKIEEIARDEGLPIAMALLPEELPHVKEPDTLLAEIRRTFLNEPADTVGVRWVEDDGEAWYQRVAELDAAITERLGPDGLLVAGVENFDLLVRKAFAKDVHGGSLREFLTRKGNRVMLLTASARGAFDRDYDRPLFKAFEEVALERWTVDECVAFFHAQRAAAGKPPLTDVQEAKAKAVATFIGGTPRLATLIGEALLEDDPLRAADLLDKLVDELTPYYKERIEVLPARSQALLDGLLRGGEKCSATELARRVGAPSQPAIAAPLDELKKDLVVVGDKAPDSAEVLLRVTDRVFAHYYRKRILSHGQEICPLEALVDLLAVFYSPEEQKREAENLKVRGLVREAAVMERLWQAEQGKETAALRPKSEKERPATFDENIAEWDRVINEDRFEEGLLLLDKALAAARVARDSGAEVKVLRRRAWTLGRLQRHDEGVATAREGASLAQRAGNVREQAVALGYAAFSLGKLERHDEAVASSREAAALAERAGGVREQAAALRNAAFSLGQLGRHDEAVASAREAAALAERAGGLREQVAALRNAAFSLSELGRHEEALATAREAAALAERTGDVGEQAFAFSNAASSLGELGRHEEALATAREAAALAERAGDVREQAYALYYALFNSHELGLHDDAAAIAIEAVGLAERAGGIEMRRLVARRLLRLRTRIGLDLILPSYELLIDTPARIGDQAAALYFDDIAHVVTATNAWPRLIVLLEGSPEAAKEIAKDSFGLGEPGEVIAAAQTANQPDASLAQARHLVAALAQAIETALDPALARLWAAVLNASAERIATQVADAAFLGEFSDILGAHAAVPARAKSLIAAAAAYHASARNPATLARLEPDLATTLMAVFPPKAPPVSRKRKPRTRRKH